ncbi:cell division control protein [Hypoxylon sp. FL0543]|nr:cell division control protein [Hypoxylon sp. FL0543]
MAPPYSNGYGYPSSASHSSYDYGYRNSGDFQSICDDIYATTKTMLERLWGYANGQGRHAAWSLAVRVGHQVRRNLTRRRLLSFPHLLVALWILVMLWGERWIFASRVRSCDWDHWEDWPAGATPHRLIFVADPQIIDPHSYPGRPWPINPLTVIITDNYMRRSYTQLQKVLHPDTVFFLGDLFDGGREWKTAQGNFDDPEWAKDHRPAEEKKYLKAWHRKYGEDFWLQEYKRFGDIFYDNWNLGGVYPSPWQRGRKLISSLPGNHDLGFGAEVKVPARHRFSAYFGEPNRVDVIGNHTFVSVDTVSLSADTSSVKDKVDLRSIYAPAQEFLKEVKATKRRAVQKEVRFWRGDLEDLTWEMKVEDLSTADYSHPPTLDLGEDAPDFPTILLTHVPLYRDPGTPCGPMREHWPPAKPPKGQISPVLPDHRNAISVSGGYQYQNVLNMEDSVNLIKSIGNTIHAFSGDDHDYCEVVHSPELESVKEITVKSLSMAMGVPTPGFQMVSLYNPIDGQGNPLPGSPKTTLQTHLCLLPKQLSTYMTYAVLGFFTLLILIARAFLVPILNLEPFALDPVQNTRAILPIFKAKTEGDDGGAYDARPSSSMTSSSKFPSARVSSTRTRGQSLSNGLGPQARASSPNTKGKGSASPGKWGWGQNRGPRIEIRRDAYYDKGSAWKPAASRSRSRLSVVGREIWTTSWRVAWMVLGFFAYLTYKG